MRIHKADWAKEQDFSQQNGKYVWAGARASRRGYMEDFMTFDTEFTTVKYTGKDGKEHGKGLIYLWTACVFGECYEGRGVQEFVKLLNILRVRLGLNNKRILVIYVHNLSADFPYIFPYIKWIDVFSSNKRSVIKANTGSGFEFRCSYKLTNMSLKKFLELEGVRHQKQSGEQYNYDKVRTPDTWLTAFERYYATCDVLGLYEAIHAKIAKDGDTMASIPMTATGYVRRDCRNACLADKTFRGKFLDQKLTIKQYQIFRDAFRGGNTHANRMFSGMIMEDIVSYDIASSYPAVMLYEKYPSSKPQAVLITKEQDIVDYMDRGYGLVMRCKFKDLATSDPIPYLSISKCILPWEGVKYGERAYIHDNGRIIAETGWTETAITHVDWEIIKTHYSYSAFECTEAYVFRMAPLPLPIRQTISDYFEKKTKLKNVAGQEYFYMKSKNNLNSVYGMMVMALIRESYNIDFQDGSWSCTVPDNMEEELNRYYKSWNSFLHYQWGVFVTAYARKRLQKAIDIAGNFIVYCDTDSVKFVREQAIIDGIEALNKGIQIEANNCETTASAYTNAGELQTLGLWDLDAEYSEFETYGAKKYAYVKNGKFSFTVSGLGKKASAELKGFDDFVIGRTYHESGRTLSEYDDDITPHYIKVDGKKYEIRSNMAILDTTYTLGITDEYADLLDLLPDEVGITEYDGVSEITYKSSTSWDPE